MLSTTLCFILLFTTIELIIVIAIIAVLASMSMVILSNITMRHYVFNPDPIVVSCLSSANAHFIAFDKPIIGNNRKMINNYTCTFTISDPGFSIVQSSPTTVNGAIGVQITHTIQDYKQATIDVSTMTAGGPNGKKVKIIVVGCP